VRSVRFVTLNLWGTRAPLAERLDVAARGLRALAPDVIFLQEVRAGDGQPNTAGLLAERLAGGDDGRQYALVYAAATRGAAGTWGPGSLAGEEGLAILSAFPVREERVHELPDARPNDRRILLSARLDLGGAGADASASADDTTRRPLWCHTTHLHWRLEDGVAREHQVVAIDAELHALGGGALHVIGGDFNAAPDTDEIRFLAGRTTLAERRTYWQDAFARARPGEPGWTWARANSQTDWLAWLELDRRIDYVFCSTERPDGRGRVLDARVVLAEPDARGVFASDHFAVLADVQL
jgi:endonuclease/exonuclease/phosphatase family metal-dependent hydrolase